nr:hypothetical protein BaRGS_034743 [Batillaria attramentaria]
MATSFNPLGTSTWVNSDSSPSPIEGADVCGLGLLNDTLNSTVDLIKFVSFVLMVNATQKSQKFLVGLRTHYK